MTVVTEFGGNRCDCCGGVLPRALGVATGKDFCVACVSAAQEDYGRRFGFLFWNVDIGRTEQLTKAGGFQLRWYGVAVPWIKNFSIGVLVRKAEKKEE